MAQFLDNTGLTTLTTLIKTDLSTLKPSACLITLKASGWDSSTKTQTATVNGVSADEASCMIIPMPAIASQSAYNDAGVNCVGQSADGVTFGCESVPSVDLKVWVSWETVVDRTFYPPAKGSIISMDLDGNGAKQYRVIKSSGEVAQVMAMYDTLSSVYNSISTTTTFGSTTAQKYEGSTLDTYLNTTWYGTLKDSVKAAIVPENVVQHCYQYYDEPDTANTPTYTYQYQYNWSDSDYENTNDVGNVTVGDRNVFALDLKDIYDYFDKVCITSNELNTLFFNQTTAVSNYIWLRSSRAGSSSRAWYVRGDRGSLVSDRVDGSGVVRPALNLNLSQLPFTVIEAPPVIETETWVIKDNAPVDEASRELAAQPCSFTSNGQSFSSISVTDPAATATYVLSYDALDVAGADTGSGSYTFEWIDNVYKTLVFNTPPTGDLLTWLQANATKQ